MGFNKCYVQDLDKVKEQYEILGFEKFVKFYIKRDSFIGHSDSLDFIREKIKEYKLLYPNK